MGGAGRWRAARRDARVLAAVTNLDTLDRQGTLRSTYWGTNATRTDPTTMHLVQEVMRGIDELDAAMLATDVIQREYRAASGFSGPLDCQRAEAMMAKVDMVFQEVSVERWSPAPNACR